MDIFWRVGGRGRVSFKKFSITREGGWGICVLGVAIVLFGGLLGMNYLGIPQSGWDVFQSTHYKQDCERTKPPPCTEEFPLEATTTGTTGTT